LAGFQVTTIGRFWVTAEVVLTDVTGNLVVQPIELEDDGFSSGKWLTATGAFIMTDVDQLRSSDANKEFSVTVVDKRETKSYRIKAKIFSSLLASK
jgi:hypothetical protein